MFGIGLDRMLEKSQAELSFMEKKDAFLHIATIMGNLDIVKLVWKNIPGLDINSRDEEDCTLLQKAVAGGHIEVTQFLLDLGADVNLQDNDGCTALTHSVYYIKSDLVRILVSKGAQLAIRDNQGSTALHHAVSAPNLEAVEYLISIASLEEINAVDLRNQTALHIAAHESLGKITSLLLFAGVNQNLFQLKTNFSFFFFSLNYYILLFCTYYRQIQIFQIAMAVL